MTNNYCVIMAGGIGSRFWPMSRNNHPKQFLDILGTGKTLIQQTFERFVKICPPENIYIVTSEAYVDLVKKQLPHLNEEQILAEPNRKNTAPCVAYASYKIRNKNPEANIIVAPSDHIITDETSFINTALKGLVFASEKDCLITLGIKPHRPDTGYGYIQFIPGAASETGQCLKVKTFTEKPDHDLAVQFIKSGEFLWNAGIFIWNVNSIIKAIEMYLPDLSQLFEEASASFDTDDEKQAIQNAYSLCTNISIDFGVMEKAKNVFVINSDFGWSDLGTYGSLYEHIRHDLNQNAVVGKHVMLYDSKNCIVNMPKNKLVVLQGLNDYIVVESDNVLLICKKSDEQQIRQFVNDAKLKAGEKFV